MPLWTTTWRHASDAWGEGFADDGWQAMAGVGQVGALHPDEMLRFFPQLAADGGRVPAAILDRIDAALAPPPVRRDHPFGRLFRNPMPTAAFPSAERLAALSGRLRAGETVAYEQGLGHALAFRAGVHPGFIWRECAVLHECATAIGWLGVVARGRAAWLPLDIAEFLAAAIDLRGGLGRPTDLRLEDCGLQPGQWGSIAVAARRRLEGLSERIRLPMARPRTRLSRSGGRWSVAAAHRQAAPGR